MLNIIWPIFIIISLSFGVITGNVDKVNNSIFESSKEAITLCINLLGVMCLWSGIINIMQKTSLINYLCNIFSPFMKFLFPNLKKSDKAYESISMNIIANVLGLGNSATPLGIKAMNDLQEKNTKKYTIELNDNVNSFKYSFPSTYSHYSYSNKNQFQFYKSYQNYCPCMDSHYFCFNSWNNNYKNFNKKIDAFK